MRPSKDRGDLPKFNGQDKGDLWRKKVTYFLANKCPIGRKTAGTHHFRVDAKGVVL